MGGSTNDYGKDTVEPLLRFRLDGREAAVIRLGLKAEVATALLLRGDDRLWRLNFRDFDYAHSVNRRPREVLSH